MSRTTPPPAEILQDSSKNSSAIRSVGRNGRGGGGGIGSFHPFSSFVPLIDRSFLGSFWIFSRIVSVFKSCSHFIATVVIIFHSYVHLISFFFSISNSNSGIYPGSLQGFVDTLKVWSVQQRPLGSKTNSSRKVRGSAWIGLAIHQDSWNDLLQIFKIKNNSKYRGSSHLLFILKDSIRFLIGFSTVLDRPGFLRILVRFLEHLCQICNSFPRSIRDRKSFSEIFKDPPGFPEDR